MACARGLLIATLAIVLAACQATPQRDAAKVPAPQKPGGYYKDDGPGDNPPANLDAIADAVPRLEALNRFANRPYTVFGVDYVPATSL